MNHGKMSKNVRKMSANCSEHCADTFLTCLGIFCLFGQCFDLVSLSNACPLQARAKLKALFVPKLKTKKNEGSSLSAPFLTLPFSPSSLVCNFHVSLRTSCQQQHFSRPPFEGASFFFDCRPGISESRGECKSEVLPVWVCQRSSMSL